MDKIKYQNSHNMFFKSFKSRLYLKSRERREREKGEEKERIKERY